MSSRMDHPTPAQLRAMRKEDLRALTEGLWEQYQRLCRDVSPAAVVEPDAEPSPCARCIHGPRRDARSPGC